MNDNEASPSQWNIRLPSKGGTLALSGDVQGAMDGKADLSAIPTKVSDLTNDKCYVPVDKANTDLDRGYAYIDYALTIFKPYDKPELSSVPALDLHPGDTGDTKRVMQIWDNSKNTLIVGFDEAGLPQIMYGWDDFDQQPNPRTLTYPEEGGTIATQEWAYGLSSVYPQSNEISATRVETMTTIHESDWADISASASSSTLYIVIPD